MKIKTYKAEELVALSLKDMEALPDGALDIKFTDKTIRTTKRRTLISWFLWRLHRDFPNTTLNSQHHIGNKQIVKGFEQKIGAMIFWDIYESFVDPHKELVWDMSRVFYQICNALHNYTVSDLGEYITSVDIFDIHALITDPVIADVRAKMRSHEIPYSEGYKIIIKEIQSPKPSFRFNGVCQMARPGLLSTKQLTQFIGSRGYTFATSGDLFPEGIDQAYMDGLSTAYDSMTESRSASRSLYMNDDPLKDSEYLNRQMQLLCASISKVKHKDCGTKHALPWFVTKEDLESLTGKYHMVDGKPVLIRGTEKELIGTLIQLRSITLCENHDTTTTCQTCLGITHRVIPKRTNLGHFLTIDPLSQISQLMLSTKHVETSEGALKLNLENKAGKWLKLLPADPTRVLVRRTAGNGNFIIKIAESEITGLNIVRNCDNVEGLAPQRISKITEMAMAQADIEGKQKGDFVLFSTEVGGEGSALSTAVLKQIKSGNVVLEDGFVIIPLTNMLAETLIITPRRGEDMISYQRTVKRFIFSSDSDAVKGDCLVAHNNPGQAVAALKRLFDEKIKTNFVHSEIFVRASMTVNGYGKDYRLPVGGEPFTFMPAAAIIANRATAPALAFQGQGRYLHNPATYTNSSGHPHAIDQMLTTFTQDEIDALSTAVD